MPSYQGELDALCGAYAIVNAMELCGLGAERQALFEIACAATVRNPWPLTLWEGTTYADLKRMVRGCLKSDANRSKLSASYPLSRRRAATNADFWNAFDDAFSDCRAVCAIIGLKKPSAHWVVAIPDGGRIAFIDSCPERPVYRKNRASLYAGFRRPKPTQWLVDRGELVVFHA